MWDTIIDAVSPHLMAGSIMAAIMVGMLLVHKLRGAKHKPAEALAILQARFARGEIGREEYEERRKVLGV